jgi:hypothetical protein
MFWRKINAHINLLQIGQKTPAEGGGEFVYELFPFIII